MKRPIKINASERKYKWPDFGILKTSNEIEEYLINRQWEHTNYFHYTNLEAAKSILKHREFWMSSLSESNDVMDANQFDHKMQRKVFTLCFSCGISENLPLWYLYSGIDGKGARLRFTESVIENLVCDGEYWLAEKQEPGKDPVCIMRLKDDSSMVCKFEDVLYYIEGEKQGIADLKYNTMTNHQIPIAEVERYKESHRGFEKGLIWFYEKETRLLVSLVDGSDAAKLVDMDADLQHEKQKKYVVLLKFDNNKILQSIRNYAGITFGPECTEEEMQIAVSQDEVFRAFKKENITLSRYSGTVKFNLIKR